jgi:NAD(P) transhydrogenase subunit alpha
VGLKIAVPKETAEHEKRVAVSAETVKKLSDSGVLVMIESGAGAGAAICDEAFKAAGAKIAKGADDLYKGADIVLRVQAPDEGELGRIPKGALLIAMLSPYTNGALIHALAKSGVDAFAMELVPRISRAQSMDVLSSQSNLAGYKAVLDAAGHYARVFPIMMTAAGTIPPAKVFVMGAGVAGLQAIATARRLGAVVSATDVRPAAKEQVESLGASFVAVENEEFKEAETAGGYAKEMSKDYQKQQAKLVAEHIAKQDIVITTALIPGRPAPELISDAMVQSMKPGSVIVDLAVEAGGNVTGSKAGGVVEKDGVKIIGHINVPSRLAADASALYAKNLLNLLNLIIDKESGKLAIDREDAIIQGVALTLEGKIVHPNFADQTPEAKKPAKKTPAKKAAPKKAAAKKPAGNEKG